MNEVQQNPTPYIIPETSVTKPRLGFLGVGWIGLNRLKAIARSEMADVAVLCDVSERRLTKASDRLPDSLAVFDPEEFFSIDLDGIVIATPNAFHAEQSIRALEKGMAVFCQKPLGRNAAETSEIIETAKKADKLLGVDFSYRFTHFKLIYDLIRSGELGEIYSASLVFHNAWGPDKKWFYDPQISGGGCVLDLGIHLADLALWGLDFPEITSVNSSLFSKGKPVTESGGQAEDFAAAKITTEEGTSIQLECSWNLPAGQDAVIEATFYGTKGGACFRNVNGSFFDFRAEHLKGTERKVLADPPDNWEGRAVLNWLKKLSAGSGFDKETEQYMKTARVIDQIYKNGKTD
ncbi:MAG: Gfo/Idh/MocA family oxidoreductase [Balneolaceae bacterium]